MARVLVADDDFLVLEVLTVYLQSCGHQVLCAANGEQARQVLDRELVEVLVTDLHMPGGDGFDLVVHARLLPRAVPVVMVSGTWTSEERAKASVLGAARLHAKPVDFAQLARDIDELARRGLDAPPPSR